MFLSFFSFALLFLSTQLPGASTSAAFRDPRVPASRERGQGRSGDSCRTVHHRPLMPLPTRHNGVRMKRELRLSQDSVLGSLNNCLLPFTKARRVIYRELRTLVRPKHLSDQNIDHDYFFELPPFREGAGCPIICPMIYFTPGPVSSSPACEPNCKTCW